jgi:N utilization substance protein A
MSTNINLIDSFQEFKDFKNIDRPTVITVLEEVFRSMIRKRFGTDENVDVIVNPDNGDLEIWRTRVVMEDGFSEDDDLEIELEEAHKYDPDLEVGDDYIEQITLESFGRRAILAARQTLVSKILELEKDEVFKKYKDREGELVIGEVYQIWKKEILVLDEDGNELILPKNEQIPADYFKKGDSIRAVVDKVDMMNNNPKIIISRTAPEFLQRLFELEVPEIFDGLITIKKIVS